MLTIPRHNTSHKATAKLFKHILNSSTQNVEYNEAFIKDCLDQGADLTVTDNYMHGNTAITWIIANTAIDKIEQFLHILNDYYKDHPEIFIAALNTSDDDGKTALFLATLKGWKHRNTKYRNSNGPMIQNAILALVEHGADLNLTDKYGNTPLHIATMRRDFDAIDYFLSKGAKAVTKNMYGLQPIQMLQYDYDKAHNQMAEQSKVYTMQTQEDFYRNYERIKALFHSHYPVEHSEDITEKMHIFENEDPAILIMKINKLLPALHDLFISNVHRNTTKEEVLQVLTNQQISIPLFKLDDTLDALITQVNKENSTAKAFGYSNKYWDCICQFFKGLFGKNRSALIKQECETYKKSLSDKFGFMPIYSSIRHEESATSSHTHKTGICNYFSNFRTKRAPN